MPAPKAGERQSDYLHRCIPEVIDHGTAKDPKQATAICYSMFRRRGKSKLSKKGAKSLAAAASPAMSALDQSAGGSFVGPAHSLFRGTRLADRKCKRCSLLRSKCGIKALLDSRPCEECGIGWSYKLAPSGEMGLTMPAGEAASWSEADFSVTFPFACSWNRDAEGDFFEVAGMDCEARHRANPVSYLDHGKRGLLNPIGLCRTRDGKQYTVTADGERGLAVATVYLSHAIPETEQIFECFKDGLLRGGSVGYLTREAKKLECDPSQGFRPRPKDGLCGLHIITSELLEVTLTSLPANAQCVERIRKYMMDGIGGKSLCQPLRNGLAPFAEGKRVWSNGWTFGV